MMRDFSDNLWPDEQPLFLRQESDTAHPQVPIPIYTFHSPTTPFCPHPLCACQRTKKDATKLFAFISEGLYLLYLDGFAVLCQTYGHSWQVTTNSKVKMCKLCRVRGYCPGCTSTTPQGAQPFSCTEHTQKREV